jgi:lipopolysaccharide transport system ATP-binding protein
VIEIKNLTKEFVLFRSKKAIVKHVLGLSKIGRDFDVVRSLDNLSLSVPSGQVHGIIGMNGAGKSTLLKILTGVIHSTSGEIKIVGRIAALLELGTGFHGELTGRENVLLNGAMQGFTNSEIQAKVPEIEAFAELGEFFDRPVKVYSSGMYVRLAFAFAVAVEPDVLIIDEALSVGDAYFQQKCLRKIEEFKAKGITILFVSHDLGAVKMLCQTVTLLSKGKEIFTGQPQQALDLYNALLAEHKNLALADQRVKQAASLMTGSSFESGNHKMVIESVSLIDAGGNEASAVESGSSILIRIRTRVSDAQIDDPTCGILIRDRLGYDVFGTNTSELGMKNGVVRQGQIIEFTFHMNCKLGPGDYTLTVALHSSRSHVTDSYHWIDRALVFQVIPSTDFRFIGVARLEPHVDVCRDGEYIHRNFVPSKETHFSPAEIDSTLRKGLP